MKKYIILFASFSLITSAIANNSYASDDLEDLKRETEILKAKLAKKVAEDNWNTANKAKKNPLKINGIEGHYGYQTKTCPVTERLVAECRGKVSCEVNVEDDNLCGDPNPKPKNVVKINYKCGTEAKSVEAEQNTKVYLNCP